ncbi:MAG: hypothetical protein PVF12_04640 [Thiohalocapsa sp.]
MTVALANVTDYDDEGEVFGHPDQVELDRGSAGGDTGSVLRATSWTQAAVQRLAGSATLG